MQSCKGVCLKYENYQQGKGRLPPEAKNFPYCAVCQTVINIESNQCPCCHTLLSYKRISLGLGEVELSKLSFYKQYLRLGKTEVKEIVLP